MTWRPTATRAALVGRASLLESFRSHFKATGALEVDTPLLGFAPSTDPAIASLAVSHAGGVGWLQTSPEAAMKRLLCAGYGDIFQICKAFRGEERSRLHRGEFTLVEWYRCGIGYQELMDEVATLVQLALPGRALPRVTLSTLAARLGAPDPVRASNTELADYAAARGLVSTRDPAADRALLLDWLLEHLVSHGVPMGSAAFVHDFPHEQSAYARCRPDAPEVAERFELVVDGVELANGWTEIREVGTQSQRFAEELAQRAARGLGPMVPDGRLLAALAEGGLPPCAGVALGLDRLVMLMVGERELGAVMAFGDDLV